MKKIILLASLVLSISAFSQVPSYVPTSGLQGWWPFNGNASDDSGNGNNGTVNGASLTEDRFGNVNKAYSLNGATDFISINNSFDFQNRTYNFWYKPTSIEATTGILIVCDNPQLLNGVTQARVIKSNNIDSVQIATGLLAGFYLGTSTNINNWQMLTYVRKINSVDLFLNGSFISSSSQIGTYVSSNGNSQTILGCSRDFSNDFYNGKIDDLGIWNRALNQQEITDLFNANICYKSITVTDTLVINANLTGFNPFTYKNSIKIYPNPTSDYITIDFGVNYSTMNGYTIKITNSLNQIVYTTPINTQTTTVSLNDWSGNGIYFVHLIDESSNTIDIKKIVYNKS